MQITFSFEIVCNMPQLLGALQVDRCSCLTNLSICTLNARCENVHQRQTVQKSRAGVIVFYFQIYRWKIFTKYVPITYLCDQMSHCAYKLWLCDKLKNVSSVFSSSSVWVSTGRGAQINSEQPQRRTPQAGRHPLDLSTHAVLWGGGGTNCMHLFVYVFER